MKKFIYILFSLLALSSCVRALDDTCSMPVAGMWASLDENGFVSEYIEFKKGNYKTFEAESTGYYRDGKVWASKESDFEKISQDEYSIIDGILYVNNNGFPISIKDSVLVIDKNKYYSLKEFTSDFYSTIVCNNPEDLTYDYTSAKVQWEYNVENCTLGNKVKVTSDVDWINSISVTDQYISFEIDENNSGETREAALTIAYPTAASVILNLKQTFAESKVVLDLTSLSCDYQGGDFDFNYDILFPRDGQSIEVVCDADWITDISDVEGNVKFCVVENNSGSARTGEIVVSYGSVFAKFIVEQGYSETLLKLSIDHPNIGFKAGIYYLYGVIENPRKSCSVKASCDVDWIEIQECRQDEMSFTVVYSVAENNEFNRNYREAHIEVEYGDVSSNMKIIQSSDCPVITMADTGIECGYAADSYCFEYLIEHARDSFELEVSTDASWITIRHYGNVSGEVYLDVAENNDGSDRIGEINLTYGNATAKFIVDQKYEKPYITASASQRYFDYKGGSSAVSYEVHNPRKGVKVTASSDSYWLVTSSSDSGYESYGKIYFDVAENNDGDRVGIIRLYYGSESYSVHISQTGDLPVINLTDTGLPCGYHEGSYSFDYSITNPRESLALKASTSASWITGLTVNNGAVSFTVSENNEGDRIGEINLTYGNATAKFIVDQKYVKPYVNAFAEKTFLIIKAARLF